MVKSDDGVIVSGTEDAAVLGPTVSEMRPVAAPEGIVKAMPVAEEVTMGAEIVPPPCLLRVRAGEGARFSPVRVICVPFGADFGLKSEIEGSGRIVTLKPPVRFACW